MVPDGDRLDDTLGLRARQIDRQQTVLQIRSQNFNAVSQHKGPLELTRRGDRTLVGAFKAWKKAHGSLLDHLGETAFESMLLHTKRIGKAVKSMNRRS